MDSTSSRSPALRAVLLVKAEGAVKAAAELMAAMAIIVENFIVLVCKGGRRCMLKKTAEL